MGYSFSWSEIAPSLARDYEVFAPDLLNIGFSDRAEIDPSLTATAERMWSFSDAVGIHKARLLASSQGGAIAMKMAARAPERVPSLILISPAHPWSEKARWQIRLFSTPLGMPIAWSMSMAPRLWMTIGMFRQYGDFSKMPPGTISGYSRPIDRKMLAYLLRVARRWYEDFVALESEIIRIAQIPTLLIWGDRDRIVSVATARALKAQFHHVGLEIIPGAGHLPYEEQPEQFLAALERGRRTLELTHV
jgi:pimeloyl-ACP methyl ester carboxylesterase